MTIKRERRQKWEVTEEVLEAIRDMSARGVTMNNMADYFGICPTTIGKRKTIDPRIDQAILEGKRSIIEWAENKLYRIMLDDDHPRQFSALTLFLKAKCGWSETTRVVSTPEQQAPSSVSFEEDV